MKHGIEVIKTIDGLYIITKHVCTGNKLDVWYEVRCPSGRILMFGDMFEFRKLKYAREAISSMYNG